MTTAHPNIFAQDTPEFWTNDAYNPTVMIHLRLTMKAFFSSFDEPLLSTRTYTLLAGAPAMKVSILFHVKQFDN